MRRVIATAVVMLAILLGTMTNAHAAPEQHIRTAICKAFRSTCSAALRVSWCESRWNPRAIGGGNVGLFQINYAAHHYYKESWSHFVWRYSDVRRNIAFAYRLSNGGRDWSAWSCQP